VSGRGERRGYHDQDGSRGQARGSDQRRHCLIDLAAG
jgi:hypothetical protein